MPGALTWDPDRNGGAQTTWRGQANADAPGVVAVPGDGIVLPSSLRVGPEKLVVLGASITNGSSASNAGTTSYTPRLKEFVSPLKIEVPAIRAGYPGQRASYIYSQLPAALALRPDILITGPDFGTNGGGEVTQSNVYELYGQYVISTANDCRAAGVRYIACKTLPKGANVAIEQPDHDGVRIQNQWLDMVARRLGIEVIDTYTPMIDPATGLLAAAFDGGDGIHPPDAGHTQKATTIGAYLQATTTSIALPIGYGVSGITANPLMLGGGAAPTAWTTTVSPSTFSGVRTNAFESPIDATDLPIGRWYSVRADASSGGHGVLRTGTATFAVTPGEELIFCGYVKSEGTGSVSAAAWNVSASAVAAALGVPTNGGPSVPFWVRLVVPAGCTSMRLILSLTTTSGQNVKGYIGAADVFRPAMLGEI
jgi:lysophospholipase L1-like esterase